MKYILEIILIKNRNKSNNLFNKKNLFKLITK